MTSDRSRPPSRMRWWTALTMAAIVLCTVMVSVVVIAATADRSSTVVADATVRRIGERTADLVRSHLEVAVETTSELELLLQGGFIADRGDELDRLLAAQVRTISQFSGAFVGFPDGSFRFVRRVDDDLVVRRIDTGPDRLATDATVGDDLTFRERMPVDTDYDPRERPWYTAAVAADDATWTSPYVFFTSGVPGVTVARSVRSDRGELLGVVGIDVRLDELDRFLEDLPIGDRAEAFITAGEVIVAAPSGYELTRLDDDGDIVLGNVDQLGVQRTVLRRLLLEGRPLETNDGGRLHVIELSGEDAPGWAILIRTAEPEASESVDRWARWAIVAVAITGLVLLASVPLLTRSLRRAIDELHHRARVDELTSVLNRGAFLETARIALEQAIRTDGEFTVAIVDVDDFKQVNDALGHQRGDEVLAGIGQALIRAVRPVDILGRLGGDEFAVAITDLDRHQVDAVLHRVQATLAHDGVDDPSRPRSTVTIGVATSAGRELKMRQLLAEADNGLLRAKRDRKGTIVWGPSLDADLSAAGPTD